MFIADLCDSSQVFEEKCVNESKVNIVEACKSNKAAKGGPKREDSRPKLRSKRGQNAAKRKEMDPARQEPPRAARGGAHGPWWGTHGRASHTHGRASLVAAAVAFLLRDFSASGGFLLCFAFYYPCIWTYWRPQFTP